MWGAAARILTTGGFVSSYDTKEKETVKDLCGRYGFGSHYFTRDAVYAASDVEAPPDSSGLKRILLCRLAIGAHRQIETPGKKCDSPYFEIPRDNYAGYTRWQGVPQYKPKVTSYDVRFEKFDTTTDGKVRGYDATTGLPQVMVAKYNHQAYADYLITFKDPKAPPPLAPPPMKTAPPAPPPPPPAPPRKAVPE